MENQSKRLPCATPNPLILSIETATRSGSICLMRGDDILAGISDEPTTSHSTHLLPAIQRMLKTAGCTLADIELFAVATGPGSFTGLRIGLATVKSFAATLGRRCAGVPTLTAVAHAAGASENTVALLPAGRGELFAQRFAVGSDGAVTAIDQPEHLKPADVWRKYGTIGRLKWAGEGATLQAQALAEQGQLHGFTCADESSGQYSATHNEGWIIAAPCANLSASVAAIALAEFQRGKTVNAADLYATYVRPSDAELNPKWPKENRPLI